MANLFNAARKARLATILHQIEKASPEKPFLNDSTYKQILVLANETTGLTGHAAFKPDDLRDRPISTLLEWLAHIVA